MLVVSLAGLMSTGEPGRGSDGSRSRAIATFDQVVGLVTQATVAQDGVKVGHVASIDPTPDGRRAIVGLEFDQPMDLRADASAIVHVKSLLGELYIEVQPGTSDALLPGDTIMNAAADPGIDSLLHTLAGFIKQSTQGPGVAELAGAVQTLTKAMKPDFDQILAGTSRLLSSLSTRTDEVNAIVANLDILTSSLDGADAGLGTAIAEAARTLATLRGHLEDNITAVESAIQTLRNTVSMVQAQDLGDAIATIPDWIGKIDKLLTLINDLANGRIPVRAEVAALPDTSTAADAAMQRMAQNPIVLEFLITSFEKILQQP
jgi:virulence factor Mce-like protein